MNVNTCTPKLSVKLLFRIDKVEILNLISSKGFYVIKQAYWVCN